MKGFYLNRVDINDFFEQNAERWESKPYSYLRKSIFRQRTILRFFF